MELETINEKKFKTTTDDSGKTNYQEVTKEEIIDKININKEKIKCLTDEIEGFEKLLKEFK